ncbi:TRL-like family protein [bacterium]|nr:MAG: TRL-like family protein [bacterium]
MRKALRAAPFLLSALTMTGCLYADVHWPRAYRSATPSDVKAAVSDPVVSGQACNTALIYLFAWGNAGYAAAVKAALKDSGDALLYDVRSDVKVKSYVFGLYSRSCTVVTGRVARP